MGEPTRLPLQPLNMHALSENRQRGPTELNSAEEFQAEREIRVWCDGCYDLVHYGHANSLRQAKLFGHKVVVGVHSDEEIARHKGPPVFTMEERAKVIGAMKWVDEVVLNAPYVTTIDTLNAHNCDFCAHGEDITVTEDGRDTYEAVKAAGRYREVKRTPDVSTTELVSRMLRIAANHPPRAIRHVWRHVDKYAAITQLMVNFSRCRMPLPHERVVYVAGAFDIFHTGHIDLLAMAAQYGDYLLVGVHTDRLVRTYMGGSYPVMTLHERLLGVLACKYVSEVVIKAPYEIGEDLVSHFNVAAVIHDGSTDELQRLDGVDPYLVPKRLGIYHCIDTGNPMTTERIVERIVSHRLEYEQRNEAKLQREIAALDLVEQSNRSAE